MPKGGKGGGGGKAAKIRLMLIKNGDAHCTHLATFSGKPTGKDVLMEAGKRLKGIAQTGKRRLYATDGYPLGDADLATAVMNDIVVVAMDEAFMPLLRNGEVSKKKMKAGGQVYSADSGYSDRVPLGIKSRPAGWDAPVIVKVSSVAAAFGAKADRVCYQPRLKISGVDPGKKRVLVLEADTMEDIDRWHQCLAGAIRRLSSAAGSVSEARQARVEQLRSSAKEATWAVGDIVDVDTEEGMQCGVRIIGPSESGDKEEMRVKFADGDVDDWPIDDFCRPKSLLEPEPEPEPELQPEPQVGWLGKRWDKGGGLADRRWFVMRADALEYFKTPEDVAKGKDARGRYPLKDAQVLPREEVQTFTKPAQVEPQGPRLGAAPEFSTLALKGLKKGQSISLGSDESASGFGTGGAVKEWQRLPKTLLEAHCRQKRRHKPVYNNTKDYFKYLLPLQGKRAEGAEIDAAKDGTATADGSVHCGLYGCKLVLPDKQKSTRDLVFYARPQKTQTLANNDAALVALITLESNIPHEKRLPEPFKTSWVELLKTGPPPPPAPPKEEAVSSGRDRSVTKKSEFQLIVMSNANMLRAETVVREWKAASADNIDSKQIDAKQEKEEQPKMTDVEELIVEDLEGADYDGEGDHSAQGQSQGQGEDGDGGKSDLLQSWMDKLSRPPSYEVASTPQAVDMYSVALSFLWEDQADSSCVAPADASCVAADQDHQSEEDEEDWETELDSSARVDELDALKEHFKDNCTVDGGDSVTIVSVCVNLPTLGATTLQCWYLTASDYPSTPPLCLLVGGSMQAPMRLHAMRALRGLASKLSGSPVMRPLLEALVKDDSVIVMPSSAELEEKAPAVEAPANHQLNSAAEHMQMQQEHAAVDVDTAFGIPSNDALVNISDPFLDSESDKTLDDITTVFKPQQTRRGKSCPMFTPHQLAGFAPANSQRIEARQRLPAAKKRSALLEILRSDQCVVVTGETGCGKTTQVPQFILEETKGECFIVCTQPRRLSAIAVASRVADERHENIDGRHSTVGYAVRGESRRTPECRLLFCTTGVLLRRMQQEDLLLEGVRNGTRVTHVIVDEVHERSVDGDHLVCLLRDVMKRRKDLKVILMSATINAELFATYFESCPTLHIPGFTHPVENYYLEDALEATGYNAKGKHENKEDEASLTVQDYAFLQENGCSDGTIRGLKAMDGREKIETGLIAELVIALAKRLLLEAEADGSLTGAILVFLPGMPGIMKVHDSLVFGRRLEEEMAMLASDILWVLPLHSTLSPNDQAKVFQRPAPGRVKVVLSTNICETSITIDDVVCVIDTARVNQTGYDPTTGTSNLQEVWCSKAARRQRAGRAGRVRPGQCWSLVTRKRSEHLLPFPAPEIERVSIEQLLLRIESALANASGRYVSCHCLSLSMNIHKKKG